MPSNTKRKTASSNESYFRSVSYTHLDVYKRQEQIYAIKGNLEFLYNALDVFVRIGKNENHKENIEVFFNNLFSKNFKENKVALFDENLNLFERCIFKNGFEIKEKLLLYSVFYYFIQNLNIGVDLSLIHI